jgi:hypothetical protein
MAPVCSSYRTLPLRLLQPVTPETRSIGSTTSWIDSRWTTARSPIATTSQRVPTSVAGWLIRTRDGGGSGAQPTVATAIGTTAANRTERRRISR